MAGAEDLPLCVVDITASWNMGNKRFTLNTMRFKETAAPLAFSFLHTKNCAAARWLYQVEFGSEMCALLQTPPHNGGI